MGRHADEGRRRGIAGWPIVLLVVILVTAALVTGYLILSKKDQEAAGPSCTSSATVEVSAGDGSAPAMLAAAQAFNATLPIVRSVCLTASVSERPTGEAAEAFTRNWDAQTLPPPAVWVPDNAGDPALIGEVNGEVISGAANDPIATSPVVLAVRAADAAALTNADGSAVSWSGLAAGTASPAGGTALRMALSDPRTNRASSYALQSLITPGGTDAVTVAQVTDRAAVVRGLDDGLYQGSTEDALNALAAGSTEFSAVPVLESDLAIHNRSSAEPLTAIYPTGPTVGDTITAIGVSGAWLDADQRQAAATFISFLSDPTRVGLLTDSDLRVPGSTGRTTAPGVDFSTVVAVMPSAGSTVAEALALTLGLPADPDAIGVTTAPSTPDSSEPATTQPITSEPASSEPAGSEPTNPPTTEPATTAEPSPTGSTSVPPTSTVEPSGTGSAAPTTTKATSKPATSKPATSTTRTTPPAPAKPTAVYTLVVDNSSTMALEDAGRTRTSWLQEVLTADIAAAKGSSVGLWTVSTDGAESGYAQLIKTGLLAGKVGTTTRSKALDTAVQGLVPAGQRWSYAAVQAAYQQATSDVVPGVTNRVVLVVSGGDNTPDLPREQVVSTIQGLAAANPGVTLDIIGIGSQAPQNALSEVAAAGGGSFTSIASADLLAGALTPLLTP